jgi:hypothetical protein
LPQGPKANINLFQPASVEGKSFPCNQNQILDTYKFVIGVFLVHTLESSQAWKRICLLMNCFMHVEDNTVYTYIYFLLSFSFEISLSLSENNQ